MADSPVRIVDGILFNVVDGLVHRHVLDTYDSEHYVTLHGFRVEPEECQTCCLICGCYAPCSCRPPTSNLELQRALDNFLSRTCAGPRWRITPDGWLHVLEHGYVVSTRLARGPNEEADDPLDPDLGEPWVTLQGGHLINTRYHQRFCWTCLKHYTECRCKRRSYEPITPFWSDWCRRWVGLGLATYKQEV